MSLGHETRNNESLGEGKSTEVNHALTSECLTLAQDISLRDSPKLDSSTALTIYESDILTRITVMAFQNLHSLSVAIYTEGRREPVACKKVYMQVRKTTTRRSEQMIGAKRELV